MQSFEQFQASRQNLNFNFKMRNLVSFILYSVLAYSVFQKVNPSLSQPAYSLMLGMVLITGVICTTILTVKIRFVVESRKNNQSLHEYMASAIKEARTKGDYQAVNQLLDSKYSVHMILVMSQYPVSAFDFSQLAKWVKLPSALKYFQDNKFTVEDLTDHTRMTDYLKSVYPEFLTALAESK